MATETYKVLFISWFDVSTMYNVTVGKGALMGAKNVWVPINFGTLLTLG